MIQHSDYATSDVEIRPMRLSERPRIDAFMQDQMKQIAWDDPLVRDYFDETTGIPDELFVPPSTRTWVALFDRRIVGVVNLTLEADHMAFVNGLCMDDDWRSSNLPLLMLVAVLGDGAMLGCLKARFDASVTSYAKVLAMLIEEGMLLGYSRDSRRNQAMECYLNLYARYRKDSSY